MHHRVQTPDVHIVYWLDIVSCRPRGVNYFQIDLGIMSPAFVQLLSCRALPSYLLPPRLLWWWWGFSPARCVWKNLSQISPCCWLVKPTAGGFRAFECQQLLCFLYFFPIIMSDKPDVHSKRDCDILINNNLLLSIKYHGHLPWQRWDSTFRWHDLKMVNSAKCCHRHEIFCDFDLLYFVSFRANTHSTHSQ